MVAFTHGEAGKKVRTNNHAERANRKLRFAEKVRYKWRQRKWAPRYVLLGLDRWWRQAAKAAKQAEPGRQDPHARPTPDDPLVVWDERVVSNWVALSPGPV